MRLSYPGKAEAKITPVSSCNSSGRAHSPSRTFPVVVVIDDFTKGIPASVKASKPAQIARVNVMSSDCKNFSFRPKSLIGSNLPICPAKLIT